MTTPLADRVIAALRERFAGYKHAPSEEQWAGLVAIAVELDKQARGVACRDFAYSAIPCGVGKTSVVEETVRQILADSTLADVGVVIFTSTLDQIPKLIREMGLRDDQFAVQTGRGNPELNQLGRGSWHEITRGPRKGERDWISDHTEAQVLFTTQQKLLHVARHRHDFETVWLYRGKPRMVRVWDEAIMPAQPLTITALAIMNFADQLNLDGHKAAASELREWALGLNRDAMGNGLTVVPDFWRRDMDDYDDLETLGAILFSLRGKDVRVQPADKYNNATAISYREILPDNFAPLLILDASGAFRVTYKAWQIGRGGLRELPSASKSYCNLTIHHWDHAAGQAAYRSNTNQETLAGAVMKALEVVPKGERLLVIHRLHQKPYANFIKRVLAKVRAVGEDPDRLRFIHWGKHRATNEFVDIRHTIVVGLLQYGQAENEAMWRAAGKVPAADEVSWTNLEATRLGEVDDHLFQGVCRGAVRKSVGGDVPEGCVLWVIFCTSGQMAIPRDRLERVFPGATVRDWTPYGTELRSSRRKSKVRPGFLETLLGKLGEGEAITFEIYDLVPKGDRAGQQRAHRYLDDATIKAALAERGVVLEKGQEKRERGGSWTNVNVYTLRRGEVRLALDQ